MLLTRRDLVRTMRWESVEWELAVCEWDDVHVQGCDLCAGEFDPMCFGCAFLRSLELIRV